MQRGSYKRQRNEAEAKAETEAAETEAAETEAAGAEAAGEAEAEAEEENEGRAPVLRDTKHTVKGFSCSRVVR